MQVNCHHTRYANDREETAYTHMVEVDYPLVVTSAGMHITYDIHTYICIVTSYKYICIFSIIHRYTVQITCTVPYLRYVNTHTR